MLGLGLEPVEEGFVGAEGEASFVEGFAFVDVDDVLSAAVGVVVLKVVFGYAEGDCAYGLDAVWGEVTHD